MSHDGNPYVGPRPFTEADGSLFFGRDHEARRLISILISERIVLMHSPSGAGKTSLIQAKLRGELVAKRFEVLPIIRLKLAEGERLGANANPYTLATLHCLGLSGPDPGDQTPSDAAETPNPEPDRELEHYLGRLLVEQQSCSKVLVFDQFEEILTLDPTDLAAKREFFRQLGTALTNSSLWVLFSMREEFVAALEPYTHLIPTHLTTTFRLPLLNGVSALLAIEKPARSAGVEFENGAANLLVKELCRTRVLRAGERVVREVDGPYVEPVQLQIVCQRLWERLAPGQRKITADDLKLGERVQQGRFRSYVDTALADYYSETLSAIAAGPNSKVKERDLRMWIDDHLITGHGLRGQEPLEYPDTQGLPNEVITALVNARLVRIEDRHGVSWVELTHDRLIEPIKASNDHWYEQHLQPFQLAAQAWKKAHEAESLVLLGQSLKNAEEWAEAHSDDLNQTEKDFLEVGRNRRHRYHQEEKARKARRLRHFLVALTALYLILGGFLVAIGWLYREKGRALKRERLALKSVLSVNDAVKAKLEFKTNPGLGLLMAYKSLEENPPSNSLDSAAHNILSDMLSQSGGTILTDGHSGQIVDVRLSTNFIITSGIDGRTCLWDQGRIAGKMQVGRTSLPPGQVHHDHKLPITKSALSDDEKWLATAGFDRKIVLYPLDKPDQKGYPLKGLSVVHVAFFKDAKGEKWVCGGGFNGEVGLWKIKEVEQGNLKGNLLPAFHNKMNETTRAGRLPLDRQDTAARRQAIGICAISVYESPSGGLLAIASAKGKMQIWIIDELLSYLNQEIDLGDILYDKANFKYDREAIGGTFTDMRFSHNGKGVLVTAGKESTSESGARLWNVGAILDRKRVEKFSSVPRDELNQVSSRFLKGHEDIDVLAIGAGDKVLLTGSEKNQCWLWDLQQMIREFEKGGGKKPFEASRFGVPIKADVGSFPHIAISPDEKWVSVSSRAESEQPNKSMSSEAAYFWNISRVSYENMKGEIEPSLKLDLGSRLSYVALGGSRGDLFVTGCEDGTTRVWHRDELDWLTKNLHVNKTMTERREEFGRLSRGELLKLCHEVLRRQLKAETIEGYIKSDPGFFGADYRFPKGPP